MTGYKFPLILWIWQQSTFIFTKMINDCFYGIFCNLGIYWYESNTLLNTIYCFLFSVFFGPWLIWKTWWKILSNLLRFKVIGVKVQCCCWKFSLIVNADFLNKLLMRTWTNWTYFLKCLFWLVCGELFKWVSFKKNLLFLENALPGQGKKAFP